MSPLGDQLGDYLRIRRALGYKLARTEKLLVQFIAFVEERGERMITIDNTLAWVTLPRRQRQLAGIAALGSARVRRLPARAR